MSDTKISELTELTTLQDGDIIPVVDISEGPITTKRITVVNFIKRIFNNTFVSAVAGAVRNFTLTNTDSTKSWEFFAGRPANDDGSLLFKSSEDTSDYSVAFTEVGHILAGDNGDADNCSFSWRTDQDTGMYLHSAENIRFATDGSNKFSIQDTGILKVFEAGYKSLVVDVNDIPNKDYTDTAIATAIAPIGNPFNTTAYHFKDELKTKSAPYEDLASFIAIGSDNLPTFANETFKAIVSVDNGIGAFRIVDRDNGDAVVAEVTGIANTTDAIVTFVINPSNAPTVESILGLQALKDSNQNTNIQLLQVIRNLP